MDEITVLRCYPLQAGDKIVIEDGPRRGDWEVVAAGDKKITLRCPVSGIQVTWDRFCYYINREKRAWPASETQTVLMA